jgi:hypothetical protein
MLYHNPTIRVLMDNNRGTALDNHRATTVAITTGTVLKTTGYEATSLCAHGQKDSQNNG